MHLAAKQTKRSLAVLLQLFAATQLFLANASVQLFTFETFEDYNTSRTDHGNTRLESQTLSAKTPFDEAILSWNISRHKDLNYTFSLRTRSDAEWSRYYVLGKWTAKNDPKARTSVNGQEDLDGKVHTDILTLKVPATQAQIRIDIEGNQDEATQLVDHLALCVGTPTTIEESLPIDNHYAIDPLDVIQRSQLVYDGGSGWCSPTSISMILDFWANQLQRTDLKIEVPEAANGVFDPGWGGTGNWPFNTAFAGSFHNMQAYVTRLESLAALRVFVESGIPIATSVCLRRLKGKEGPTSGHLVVCVGFDKAGNPIINDPGTTKNIRWVPTRENFTKAWANSKNTVYVIHPKEATFHPKN
jgi:uncharacterized protein YvpB